MNQKRVFYMNCAEALDSAFGIYKKSFWEQLLLYMSFYYGTIIIFFLPIYIFFLVFTFGFAASAAAIGADGLLMIGVIIVVAVIANLLYNLIMGIISCGNFFMTKQVFFGEKKALGKAFGEALRSIPKSMGAALARHVFYYIPLVFIVPVILDLISGSFASHLVINILCIVLTVIAYFLLDTYLFFVFPAAISDKISFFKAVGKGISLIKGCFWKILGIRVTIQLVLLLISYFLMGGITGAAGVISGLDGGSNFGLSVSIVVLLFQYLISFALGIITGPLIYVLNSALFLNEKVEKDGLDIEMGIQRLEGELNDV